MYAPEEIAKHSESLLVHFRRVELLKKQAVDIPSINLSKKQLCDLELLLNRAFYPLVGYAGQEDYESILNNMRLADGTLWPIPICLDVSEETAAGLKVGDPLALRDREGFLLGLLKIKEIWRPDLKHHAVCVFGTSDPAAHPGVEKFLNETRPVFLGGCIEGLHLPQHYDFPNLRLSPSEFQRICQRRGWRNILAFQTEEYLHRAHQEMLHLVRKENRTNILIQSVVNPALVGDIDHFSLINCHQEFVKTFPGSTVMHHLLPLYVRPAGPRQALLEAIVHKNYGCSHLLIAKDHADPFSGQKKTFYPTESAISLCLEHEQELEIKPVRKREMFYVEEKAQHLPVEQIGENDTVKTLPPEELRRRLEFDIDIPEWFTFPEVANELRRHYPPRNKQGFTILITGLSGAGKSTIAKVLYVKFMEMRERPVSLLDGDIVRRNLSSELTFTREHRNLNVTRIGFVASEITKNGGIAICAPIAPYEESRQEVREMISRFGGYVEVYVSTPIEVCEQRDRKGIYAKAKAGLMKGVTGVDDPYIPPSSPELSIDTSDISPGEAAQTVLLYLAEEGYIR